MMLPLMLLAGVLAGAVAAVAGFGIGSLLTPLLALETGTRLAVAAVAVPHFIGTLQRFVRARRLRHHQLQSADWQGARLPVYLAAEWRGLTSLWPPILLATAGVVIGTELGTRALVRVPERAFRRLLALLLVALGVYMLSSFSR